MIILLILSLFACSSAPPPRQPDNSRQAAEAAFADMDGTSRPGVPGTTTPGQSAFDSLDRPIWLDSPETVYNRNQYVHGVGHGNSREQAQRSALAALTAYFGQSIQIDQTVTNTYYEAIRSGNIADYTDDLAIQNTIRTQSSLDSLIGAEIRGNWHDARNNQHYSIAVMEIAQATSIYSEMIRSNQTMINNLTNMNTTEKNSLRGYSRYLFAGVVADINVTYSNLLTVLGMPSPNEMSNGNSYRLEAQNIAGTIPIAVMVYNDRANRIQGAFTKAFTEMGFRTGGNNPQYICEVDITISPVDLGNNQNTFIRLELSANLKDELTDAVIFTWSFNERHGHLNASEAENRAFSSAENKIAAEYKDYMSEYLSKLIDK